ncbi:MAG: HlyD family efflux transporter periplasmic adaptor subunit [Planctomycetes bacterium]|nr:HlyD family efflux transporter periplasmic adaptor subunit [Planctomycetota bacterium]
MSTDVLPETQSFQARSKHQDSPGARWWKRGLVTIAAVAVVAIVAAFIPGTISLRESGPKLTHTITRGDLLVTVTEQGTLESSNNTEIKCKVRGYNTVIWVIEGGTEVKAGDELVRLDTKRIEDAISLQTTNAHTARAALERSKADVARAVLAIPAYLDGTYRTQLKSLERWLEIAETNLRTSKKMLAHTEKMFKRGYVTELEVQGNALTVTQAELELEVRKTEIDILEKYTKKMRIETLNGNLKATRSKLLADKAGLAMDEGRRDLVLEELKYCVIKAERSGLVIYPSAAEWKETPDIEEGATVRKDQVLLLMPDLTKMQVKVGIHESVVDRIKPGLAARITLPDKTLDGEVSSVASVTRPAGWWTGNVVKYDTIIELPSVEGLKPGMSAEVVVTLDRHTDVLAIPVAAVLETVEGDFCWVKTSEGAKRRSLKLGDTDDSFIIVEAGLKEGDEVVLNPLAFIEEAQSEVLKPIDGVKPRQQDSPESGNESRQTVNLETDHVD